jgi:hypothetical protein
MDLYPETTIVLTVARLYFATLHGGAGQASRGDGLYGDLTSKRGGG